MTLPDSIRIGGTDYKIVEEKDLHDGGTWLNGHIIYNHPQIRIESEMDEYIKWVTVWHEVLHGILQHAGQGDHDEKMIEALGYGVTQVLRDNEYLRGTDNGRAPTD